MRIINVLMYVAIIVVSSYSLNGQEDQDPYYLFENIPSPPEASGLGEYGDVTNNPYTGKANIGIPIYSINFEGLQIPIQLSYDTGGVMVGAEASWVGLNWSLSANFGISRTVNGKDDFADFDYGDGNYSGFVYNDFLPTYPFGEPEMNINDIRTIHQRFDSANFGVSNMDTQPDVFDVSLFGKSYKFRLEKKGASSIVQAHVFNDPNVVITYNLSDNSFTIVDDRGFIYKFITKEYSTGYSSLISSVDRFSVLQNIVNSAPNRALLSQITSWKLDQVTSPRGRILYFNYQDAYSFSVPSYSGSVNSGDENTWSGNDYTLLTATPEYSGSTALMYHHYLSSISGDFGSVEFIMSDREDIMTGADLNALSGNAMSGGLSTVGATGITTIDNEHGTGTCPTNIESCKTPKKLDAIRVKDFNGNQVLEASLITSYFNSSTSGFGTRAIKKRLKLDEVVINDRTYSFTYDNPNSLPDKDSDDVDFWGYYNAAGNDANSLGNVPSIGRFVVTEDVSETLLRHRFIQYNGASKKANFNAGKTGILTSIKYPTGGSTTLTYEPHDAIVLGPSNYSVEDHTDGLIKWTSMTDEDLYNFTYIYIKMANDPTYSFYNSEAVGGASSGSAVYENSSTYFNVPTSAVVRSNGSLITEYDAVDSNGFPEYGDEPAIAIQKLDGTTFVDYYFYNDWEDPINPDVSATTSVSNFAVLTAGDYRIIQTVPVWDGLNTIPAVRVLNGTESEATATGENHYTLEGGAGDPNGEPTIEQFEIGGLRIASITNYNNDGSFVNKKSFGYRLPNNNTSLHSSGKLMNELIYFSKAYGFYSYDPRNYGPSSPLRFSSNNSLRNENSAQGSHIGYSNTQEYILDENDNVLGSFERTYYNKPNKAKKIDLEVLYSATSTSCSWPSNQYISQDNLMLLDAQPYSYSYANGNVLREEVYSAENRKMYQSNYQYYTTVVNEDSQDFISVMALHVPDPYSMDTSHGCLAGPGWLWPDQLELNQFYSMPESYWKTSLLTKTESLEFFDDTQYRSVTERSFNPTTLHLKTTRSYHTEDDFTTNYYNYFYESSVATGSPEESLILANRLSEIQSIKAIRQYQAASNTLSERRYDYAFIGATPADYPMVSEVQGAKADEPLEEMKSYQEYDAFGNVLQVQSRDGLVTSYVWGYNNQHIIAKVENKTWSEISSLATAIITASNNDDDTCLAGGGCNEASLLTALDTFRNHSSLTDAMVTTYTYNPLIGVTSIKDPSDGVLYYLYDSSNRLSEVRDRDGFLVKKYEYNITDDLIPLIVYDALPGGDPDEDQDGCLGPFCDGAFKTLAQFTAEDRTVDENGNKHLYGNIVVDQFPSNNIFNISYKILPYGGSGNYEYRWRTAGGDYGNKQTTVLWSTPYDCLSNPDGQIEVICEIEDTTTGTIYEARVKHAVICQN